VRFVSDSYIALFSHFVPCGVWEAVYIIDGCCATIPTSSRTRPCRPPRPVATGVRARRVAGVRAAAAQAPTSSRFLSTTAPTDRQAARHRVVHGSKQHWSGCAPEGMAVAKAKGCVQCSGGRCAWNPPAAPTSCAAPRAGHAAEWCCGLARDRPPGVDSAKRGADRTARFAQAIRR
jgi:hypothetical protein